MTEVMNELLSFVVSGILGVLLGLVFFWSLWSTVKRLDRSRHPALMLVVSFLLRISIVFVGFYFIVRYGGWSHVLIAVFGLILSRMFISQRLKHHYTTRSRIDDDQP